MLELLNQLDGFSSNDKIKVIAATNQPESLDPALLRSGRLDRKVELPHPGETARAQILKIHEMYAHLLHSKGDFDGSMSNFISAKTSAASVLSLFNEFVPSVYHSYCNDSASLSTAFMKSKAKMDEAEKAAHANEDGESNLPSDTNKAE